METSLRASKAKIWSSAFAAVVRGAAVSAWSRRKPASLRSGEPGAEHRRHLAVPYICFRCWPNPPRRGNSRSSGLLLAIVKSFNGMQPTTATNGANIRPSVSFWKDYKRMTWACRMFSKWRIVGKVRGTRVVNARGCKTEAPGRFEPPGRRFRKVKRANGRSETRMLLKHSRSPWTALKPVPTASREATASCKMIEHCRFPARVILVRKIVRC